MISDTHFDYSQLFWEFIRDRLLSQSLTSSPKLPAATLYHPWDGTRVFFCSVQTVPLHTVEHKRKAGVFQALATTVTTIEYYVQLSARLLTDQVRCLEATATTGGPPGSCEHPMHQLKALRRLTWFFNTKKICPEISFPCSQESLFPTPVPPRKRQDFSRAP